MLNSLFGLSKISDHVDAISTLARAVGESITDGRVLRQLMIENYDTFYGIFNHLAPDVERKRPLALVALHEKETIGRNLRIHSLKDRFIRMKVTVHSGMSWPEFIQLPRAEVEDWLDRCFEAQQQALKPQAQAEAAARELEATLHQRGQG